MTKKDIDNLLVMGNSHFQFNDNMNKPNGVSRFQIFLSIKPLLKGSKYWYALRHTYIHSDDLYNYRFDIREAFSCEEPNRDKIMYARERKYLEKLPQKITIYRGMTLEEKESGCFGISWTLKKKTAEFFANRYWRNFATKGKKKVVHSITIDKNEVIAYFAVRSEYEIIYLSQDSENPYRPIS
jgi:hypothetical protein